ncbi:CRISPR-associated endonuclease Cas1 [Streptomyces sp. NPDC051677]|uniref:CRISPR-associated endonuclease Cas1 n=1 Tax=Streptomyces sp. NPDC051677 TaxID=3365669 RepID=UPI0037CED1EB
MADVYRRESTDPRVIVVDGYGATINVRNGHLVISDGIGPHRRTRQLPKVERNVRRILVLNARGSLTFDAVQWCKDVGISLVYTDSTGEVLLCSDTGNDARLRRAQAFAGQDGPYESVGLDIVKRILSRKLSGQAANLRAMGHEKAAREIDSCAVRIEESDTVDLCRSWEGAAASAYWGAWTGTVAMPWKDADAEKVPAHWTVYVSRANLTSGKARGATDPVNAMLNYCYRLAEAECVLACHSVGLDPAFGMLHLDKDSRDSFALDLLEVVRPEVERLVLKMLGVIEGRQREFHRSEFHETREGTCRLVAPLTHELAEQCLTWARSLAPIVREYALMLAHATGGNVTVPNPTKDKTLMREPASGQKPRKNAAKNEPRNSSVKRPQPERRERATRVPCTVRDVIPSDLWEQVSEQLPKPRQSNKADQRLSKHGVLAGAVCTEILRIPGRHLPPTIADRKTVRTHLQRWKADGTWDALVPVLTGHPHVRTLMSEAGKPGA